jgi:hypothetical protein
MLPAGAAKEDSDNNPRSKHWWLRKREGPEKNAGLYANDFKLQRHRKPA